ncbi:hypothetical protein HQ584_03145 [Patescibacteria group bacterium]|nr:hypothetical protein [Patescibacteria group bacterium]
MFDTIIKERGLIWVQILQWDLLRYLASNKFDFLTKESKSNIVNEYCDYLYTSLMPVFYNSLRYRIFLGVHDMFYKLGGIKEKLAADAFNFTKITQFISDNTNNSDDIDPDYFLIGYISTYIELNSLYKFFNAALPQFDASFTDLCEDTFNEFSDLFINQNCVQVNEELVSQITCQENEAALKFCKSHYLGAGNIEEALKIFWDGGLNLGNNKPWNEILKSNIRENRLYQNEKIHEKLVQFTLTVSDFLSNKNIQYLLVKSSNGELIRMLKIALKHDLIDNKRFQKAKKRDGLEVPFSNLISNIRNGSHEMTDDELLSRITEIFFENDGSKSVENRVYLREIVSHNGLSKRERQALMLMVDSTLNNGEQLTYEQLGKKMGVDKGTARRFFLRACLKLRKSNNNPGLN